MAKMLVDMQVKTNETIAPDTMEMVLDAPSTAKQALPGQFLHIHIPGTTLRRPLSIADVDPQEGNITVIYKIVGSGTNQLATYRSGDELNAMAPNGNPFDINQVCAGQTVLLIGGGIGVPPLYYLASEMHRKGVHIITVIGFQTEAAVFYEDGFRQFGEVRVVTDDGTYGHHGVVTDMLEKLPGIDMYFACGPVVMLQAVQRRLKEIPGFLSLEERMGCGIGACLACVVEKRDGGYMKICENGPVFASEEVAL